MQRQLTTELEAAEGAALYRVALQVTPPRANAKGWQERGSDKQLRRFGAAAALLCADDISGAVLRVWPGPRHGP